jgi:signal transduction histidine kinase
MPSIERSRLGWARFVWLSISTEALSTNAMHPASRYALRTLGCERIFRHFLGNTTRRGFSKKTTDWVMEGNQFIFSHPSEIPFDLGDLKPFVDRYGPKSSAVIPMGAGSRVIGAASFGKFRSPKPWSPELLAQLGFAVGIFSRAIERKQAEAAAQVARAELALAQRRSMMGELVASLAHELNQPLGAILSNLGGLARLLSEGNPKPAFASRAVKDAIEDAKRAGRPVHDFES